MADEPLSAEEYALMELAVNIARSSTTKVPDDCVVAVFVFRNEPETNTLHTGWVSMTAVGLLRRWLKVWLRDTEPKVIPIKKETIQ